MSLGAGEAVGLPSRSAFGSDPVEGLLIAWSANLHLLQVSSLDEPLRLGRISMHAPVSTGGRLRKGAENIIFLLSQILIVVRHPRSLTSDRRSLLKGSYSKAAIKNPELDL
jgi:hypothetical protein